MNVDTLFPGASEEDKALFNESFLGQHELERLYPKLDWHHANGQRSPAISVDFTPYENVAYWHKRISRLQPRWYKDEWQLVDAFLEWYLDWVREVAQHEYGLKVWYLDDYGERLMLAEPKLEKDVIEDLYERLQDPNLDEDERLDVIDEASCYARHLENWLAFEKAYFDPQEDIDESFEAWAQGEYAHALERWIEESDSREARLWRALTQYKRKKEYRAQLQEAA